MENLKKRIEALSPSQRKAFEDRLKKAGIDIAAVLGESKESIYSYIEPVERKHDYDLSSAQKRLYVIHQLNPESISYNQYYTFEIGGDLDKDTMMTFFRGLIKRHEILRTSFESVGHKPMQRVHQDAALNFEYCETDEAGGREILQDFRQPFDLLSPPLMKVGYIKIGEARYILIIDKHHLITDYSSYVIILKELVAFLNGLSLPPLRIQYKDFAQWQYRSSDLPEIKKQEEYWLNEFAGEIPVLNLPIDFDRPSGVSFEGSAVEFVLPKEEATALKGLARQEDTTLYMVLLALFYILLAKMCNQEDIVIGTVTDGRRHADLEPLIGMFANTLAVRNFPTGDKIFTDFLKEVKSKTMGALENQDYRFEDLVEQVVKKRLPGRHPLFDVYFHFYNKPVLNVTRDSLSLKKFKNINISSKLDLNFLVDDLMEDLIFNLEYCTRLYRQETIEILLDNYHQIIKSVIKNCHARIRDISISHGLLAARTGEPMGDFSF